MRNTRIRYIDVAKGLLIILVIFHHVPQYYLLHGENTWMKWIDGYKFMYTSFFMASFFILSGYCSNFEKAFRSFTIKNIRTLVVPSFVFTCLAVWLRAPFSPYRMFSFDNILYLIRWGGQFWFIPAMFLSRELYWFLCHYVKFFGVRIAICILFLILGLILATNENILNIWRFKHALIFVPFIAIGQELKTHMISTKTLTGAAIIFVIFLAAALFLKLHVPSVTLSIDVQWYETPILLFYAITGTALIVRLSQVIDSCGWIEFVGRNSIVFYMVHSICLSYSTIVFSFLLENHWGIIGLLMFYMANIIISLFFSFFIICMFSVLRIDFLLGK